MDETQVVIETSAAADKGYRELANTIAQQADAIAQGRRVSN